MIFRITAVGLWRKEREGGMIARPTARAPMIVRAEIDVARLLGPRARRSPEMAALWAWMQEEDAKLPDPATLPIDAQRALIVELNERWNADGPTLRERLRVDVPGAAAPISCEWLTPQNEGEGALLYIHGGGWAVCNLDTHRKLASLIAVETGLSVLSVDYRLAPEHPFPAGLMDCVAVWRLLGANRGGPLLAAGDSAGANLALALALSEGQAGRRAPDGLLLFYGVYSPDLDSPSYLRFADDYGLTRARMEQFWDWYASREARLDPLAAPVEASQAMLAKLPPLFLNAAGLDPLLSDTLALTRRLDAAGVEYDLVVHEGVHHGFMMWSGRLKEADAAIARAGEFARRIVGTGRDGRAEPSRHSGAGSSQSGSSATP
jgi:acetyl esterase